MSDLPFDRRDFIRHLPELLAGKEPVMATPEAKRFVREDPEARVLIRAAAETAIAMDTGMRRMRRTAPFIAPALKRPMEIVKRHFARRMVDVFWEQAMALYAEATAGPDTFLENVHDREWKSRSDEEVELVANRLRESLGLRNDLVVQRTASHSSPRPAHTSFSVSPLFDRFRACTALVKKLDGVAVAEAQATEVLVKAKSCDWRDLASKVEGVEAKHVCYLEAADREFLAGNRDSAFEFARLSSHLVPESVAATLRTILFGTYLSAGPRTHGSQAKLIELLSGPRRHAVQSLIRADRSSWREALEYHRKVHHSLPRELADLIAHWSQESGS